MNDPQRNALFSVHDEYKPGLGEFGHALAALNFQLFASGGTAACLREYGLEVKDVAEIIGTKALFGHRLATLSWQLHGGILRRNMQCDLDLLRELGLPEIHLVCVGFYPTHIKATESGSSYVEVNEWIDIGGPTLADSAAKAAAEGMCIPVTRVEDRLPTLGWLQAGEPRRERYLRSRAVDTYMQVGKYYTDAAMHLAARL